MTPLRGWSRIGCRLIQHVPHGHWKTTTLLCGLRSSGPVAPLVIDGAVNGDIFRAWTEQQLVRELRRGDVVIMDNLNSHKVAGVAEAIRRVGARVRYLPPYSPDLNPIEMLFAKLKHRLRAAQQRTIDALWNCIGQLMTAFPAHECHNYLRHAGYTQK
jgi:transposase